MCLSAKEFRWISAIMCFFHAESVFSKSGYNVPLTWIEAFRLPVFMCAVHGHRIRSEFEVSWNGDVKRNVEKTPE